MASFFRSSNPLEDFKNDLTDVDAKKYGPVKGKDRMIRIAFKSVPVYLYMAVLSSVLIEDFGGQDGVKYQDKRVMLDPVIFSGGKARKYHFDANKIDVEYILANWRLVDNFNIVLSGNVVGDGRVELRGNRIFIRSIYIYNAKATRVILFIYGIISWLFYIGMPKRFVSHFSKVFDEGMDNMKLYVKGVDDTEKYIVMAMNAFGFLKYTERKEKKKSTFEAIKAAYNNYFSDPDNIVKLEELIATDRKYIEKQPIETLTLKKFDAMMHKWGGMGKTVVDNLNDQEEAEEQKSSGWNFFGKGKKKKNDP